MITKLGGNTFMSKGEWLRADYNSSLLPSKNKREPGGGGVCL